MGFRSQATTEGAQRQHYALRQIARGEGLGGGGGKRKTVLKVGRCMKKPVIFPLTPRQEKEGRRRGDLDASQPVQLLEKKLPDL